MAEELQIVVGADIAGATRAFKKLREDISTAMKGGEQSLTTFARQFQQTSNGLGNSAKKVGKDFTNLNRVLADLPYGIQGISNNLQQIFPAAGALGLAVTALTTALTFSQTGLQNWIRGAGGAGDSAQDAANDIRDAAGAIGKTSEEYKKAFENVTRLTEQVKLAKEGFISKRDVINQYNSSLGETIGKVRSLDEVEAKLASAGQAYIKFTLLKAAANVALGKAAEEAFKAEEKRFGKINTSTFGKVFNPERTAAQNATANSKIAALANKANNKLEAEANRFDQEQARFTDIANNFSKEAATITKNFKFDFFKGALKPDKVTAKKFSRDYLAEIFREMQKADLKLALIPEVKNDDKSAIKTYIGGLRRQMEKLGDNEKLNAGDLFKGEVEFKLFLADGGQTATALQEQAQRFKESLQGITDKFAENIVIAAAGGIVKAFSGDDLKDVFGGVFNILGSYIQELGKQMIAASSAMAALKKALSKLFANPVAGLAVGIGMVALGEVIKNGVSKIKPFAKGGLAFGPTLGLVGEGRGTNRSNPEVIAPLDKLKNFIGSGTGFPAYLPMHSITNKELRLWYARADAQARRTT